MRQSTEVMMTSSNGNIFRVTGPLCGEFTWINSWVNSRKAGDLSRHRDVKWDTMKKSKCITVTPWWARCRLHCLLSRLFRRRSKKTSKLRVTSLCEGNQPAIVRGFHRWPVYSPLKRPVTWKMFPFDDIIINRHFFAEHLCNKMKTLYEEIRKYKNVDSVWVWNGKNLQEQGKSEGFDSCDRPSNLIQIGFKSSIFQPVWRWNFMDDPEKQSDTSSMLLFASFRSHWWIQTGVTVRKRQIWVKFDDFLAVWPEIWLVTLKNNRSPLLSYFKLCVSFHTHWWIQTGVTVRKRPIWVKINYFFSRVTFKLDGWPWKTIGHLFYDTLTFVQETLNSGQNRRFLEPCDLAIWRMALQNNRVPLLYYFKLCVSFRSHWWIQTGYTVRKRPIWVKFDDFRAAWPWNLTDGLEKQ